MSGSVGVNWLERLRRRWMILSLAKVLLISLAISIAVAALLKHFLPFGIIGIAATFILSFSLLSIFIRYWAISLDDICRFVNYKYPEVEESADLLVLPNNELSGLQHLQASRINLLFVGRKLPTEPFRQILYPVIAVLLSLIFLYIVAQLPNIERSNAALGTALNKATPVVKENVPA
ncbi:MAG: hypothetical protein JWQ28_3001, partial [Pedobacter sp.]|nr:hypothetical protein [Pedobacter sp.]